MVLQVKPIRDYHALETQLSALRSNLMLRQSFRLKTESASTIKSLETVSKQCNCFTGLLPWNITLIKILKKHKLLFSFGIMISSGLIIYFVSLLF